MYLDLDPPPPQQNDVIDGDLLHVCTAFCNDKLISLSTYFFTTPLSIWNSADLWYMMYT